MKKAEPQNGKIIAGTAKWHRFPALHHIWVYQRQQLVIFGAVLAAAIITTVWWFAFSNDQQDPQVALGNGYEKSIEELQAQEVPQEPIDKVYYYSQLGQNSRALHRYQAALDYFLQAQTVVDDNKLSDRASFYEVIAEMYDKLGNKLEASLYRKKAEDRMKATQPEGEQPAPQESTWE